MRKRGIGEREEGQKKKKGFENWITFKQKRHYLKRRRDEIRNSGEKVLWKPAGTITLYFLVQEAHAKLLPLYPPLSRPGPNFRGC